MNREERHLVVLAKTAANSCIVHQTGVGYTAALGVLATIFF
jgi:hypothetical protein